MMGQVRGRSGAARCIFALIAGFALAQPGLALESVVSARQALARMGVAADTLSYRGIATYEQAGTLTTLRIVRAVRDGHSRERLEYLDGPPREVIRRGREQECRGAGLSFHSRTGVEPNDALEHYLVSYRDEGRVAGRPVRQIQLLPRDNYRYGHLLGLDQATGLLLQTQVFDHQGALVERFQFTSISIGAVIDEAELEPRHGDHLVVGRDPCPEPGTEPAPTPWQLDWVPPGFGLSRPPRVSVGGAQEMHYSDGFSSFSVFVEPTPGPVLPVEARRGPTAAFLIQRTIPGGSFMVCVVGELPLPTARQIAASVASRSDLSQAVQHFAPVGPVQ
jgi:sigma-E factor negative regulatory protein RseB